jgi:hypothetical protein
MEAYGRPQRSFTQFLAIRPLSKRSNIDVRLSPGYFQVTNLVTNAPPAV